jgi:mono/diheme cytochrome c family protein
MWVKRYVIYITGLVLLLFVSVALASAGSQSDSLTQGDQASGLLSERDAPILDNARDMIREGRQTFRFDTFGDEAFWGGQLQLHQAIQGERFGGVGSGLSPKAALALGLKVDREALPHDLVEQLQAGQVNLDDPAVTLALLKLKAVVGVTGFFNRQGTLRAVGIQCAICHSTVDDSFAPGIGHRLDGWANRDLNIGAIAALAPNLEPLADLLGTDVATVRTVLNSWGPGKFDAELILDGKAFRPDGKSAATLLPPAFGLAGVNLHTWTGWGSVTHWNAFVANLDMHGQGTFYDPRLNNAEQFPIAAREGFGNVRNTPDLITAKLAALHFYQLAIAAPRPPKGSFDREAAARGRIVFNGKAQCATCHVPPLFTEPGWNLHTPAEIGIDDFQANRAPDRRYRTAPLKGLWTHTKGGFYHDGRFATLRDVVNHYNTFFNLGLTEREINDLIEYLKSL